MHLGGIVFGFNFKSTKVVSATMFMLHSILIQAVSIQSLNPLNTNVTTLNTSFKKNYYLY